MLVGVPTVCLEGNELSSVIDTAMSKRMGLPDYCRAKNVGEYIDIAVELIENVKKRSQITDQIVKTDLNEKFFLESPSLGYEFASALRELFSMNKDRISETKVWYQKKK